MMLALISNTLLYSIDCFATTNCKRARMTPRINAMGVSIQRAPNAKAVVNEIQDGNTSDTDGCQSVHEYHDPETIQRWFFHNLLEVFGCVLNSYNIMDDALFCQNCRDAFDTLYNVWTSSSFPRSTPWFLIVSTFYSENHTLERDALNWSLYSNHRMK
jgi:hypothetical protein